MNEWHEAEQHVERAHELYELGRLDEAETELRQALALNPFQSEWQFNLGLTLDAAGRHKEAADVFREAYDLDKEDEQAALMVGVSLLRSGEAHASLEWLDRAEKLDPGNVSPYVNRIEAYSTLGQHEQAELMFYMAQQIDPKAADAYLLLADSLMERGQYEKAVWCLREAAKIDAELPGVQGKLAEVYAATGRHERARQLYLRELRNEPGDIETLLALGGLLVDMGRFPEAGEKFRRILEIEPDNAEAHFELGDLAEREGRLEDALRQYDVVLRLEPEYPGARRRMAAVMTLRGRGEDHEAVESLIRRELSAFRERGEEFADEDLEELGSLAIDAGLAGEAVKVFRALVERQSEQGRAQHLLSVALLEAGDRAGGMEAAKKSLKLDPRNVAAMHNMAMACVRERRWKRARYWIGQARRIDPDDASIRRLAAALRLHMGIEVLSACFFWWARRK